MSKMGRHHNEHKGRKRIANVMKQRLVLLITFLSAILIGLIFQVGKSWWPVWMIEYQRQITGILLLAIICSIVASPIIIEADTHPRALSGPGKNPKGPRLE